MFQNNCIHKAVAGPEMGVALQLILHNNIIMSMRFSTFILNDYDVDIVKSQKLMKVKVCDNYKYLANFC